MPCRKYPIAQSTLLAGASQTMHSRRALTPGHEGPVADLTPGPLASPHGNRSEETSSATCLRCAHGDGPARRLRS
ncbi:hypothetical protein ACFPRL_18165 [Pseudoclavibacter helvolus]